MINNKLSELFIKLTPVDKVLIIFVGIGIVIFGLGFFRGIVEDSQVQVDYVKGSNSVSQKVIIVDVSGEVVKPGVYELREDSRIKDALVAAEGLSGKADRDYVKKNINLAEKVIDGQKIYIPEKSVNPPGEGYSEANNGVIRVNINSASESDLDTLKGIGSVRAKQIIEGRPYKNVDELVTKGVLPKSILDKIKADIIAY